MFKDTMDKLRQLSKSASDLTTPAIYQYASELVDFSSQYGKEGGYAYTAINLAKGQLDIYPAYGDFKEAFVLVI